MSGDNIKINRALMGRLIHIRSKLLNKYPFYGKLAMNLRLVIANCGTAATDMENLIFDPEFLDELSDEEVMAVMMHEILHCVLKHCIRGKGKIQYIYNIACDIVVNSNILESMGVKEFQVAGENMMHRTPSRVEGRLKTADDVYYELMSQGIYDFGQGMPDLDGDSPFTEQKIPGKSERNSERNSEKNSKRNTEKNTEKNSEENSNKNSQENKKHNKMIPAYDNHDIWTCVEDEDGSLEGSWNENVIRISKEKGCSLSGCPHAILEIIQDYDYKGKLKWKEVLKDFITSYVSYVDYTFAPPDRRFSDGDYFLPAENEIEDDLSLDMIWFCVDTSGSISPKELTELYIEVRNVIEECPGGVKLISFFDTQVTEPVPFRSKQEFESVEPTGGGGTSFDIIFQYLKDNMMQNPPKAIVILTDGYASEPNEEMAMGIPVLWVINNNQVDMSWGEVVRV